MASSSVAKIGKYAAKFAKISVFCENFLFKLLKTSEIFF